MNSVKMLMKCRPNPTVRLRMDIVTSLQHMLAERISLMLAEIAWNPPSALLKRSITSGKRSNSFKMFLTKDETESGYPFHISFSKPLELSKDEKPSFNTRNLKIDGNSGRLNAVVPQRYQQVIGELSQQKTFPKVTVSRAEVSSLSSPEKIPISRKSKTHRFETKSAKPSLQPLNSGLLTPSSALAFRYISHHFERKSLHNQPNY